MIFSDFFKALGQLGDRRFRRVLWQGIGLSLLLLFGIYAAVLGVISWFAPETVTMPWIGPVNWVDNLISGASILLMLAASVFLMVPVAAVFTSLFLDGVADAVEARHYPGVGPVAPVNWGEALKDSARFLGILVLANLAALVLYLMLPPAAPLIFWALNGYLLGREYFQLVAMRHLGRDQAKQLWRANSGQVWLAGAMMALPLSIPLVNLLVPILGAATFTHLFHRLYGKGFKSSQAR